MIITNLNNSKKVMFEDVPQGNIISYNGNLYMKIPDALEGDYNVNVVLLETGELKYVPSNMLILWVENYEFKYSI